MSGDFGVTGARLRSVMKNIGTRQKLANFSSFALAGTKADEQKIIAAMKQTETTDKHFIFISLSLSGLNFGRRIVFDSGQTPAILLLRAFCQSSMANAIYQNVLAIHF